MNCSSCGSPIPKGQGKSCSMCYGDMEYGRDGYYREWAEEQMRHEAEEMSEAERDEKEQVLSDFRQERSAE